MEDQQLPPTTDSVLINKPSKNKSFSKSPSDSAKNSGRKGQKAPKRASGNDLSVPQQDMMLASGDDYRALRRKYLLLEEESFGLGAQLKEVEDEVNALEEEKLLLLDELVVLEGLIHPAEIPAPKLL